MSFLQHIVRTCECYRASIFRVSLVFFSSLSLHPGNLLCYSIFSSTYIFFVIMMIQCCTDILRCIVPVCTQIILCVCTIVLGGFLSSQDLHTERNRERGTSPDSGKDPFYYIYTYCIYQASELFFFLSSSPSLYTWTFILYRWHILYSDCVCACPI